MLCISAYGPEDDDGRGGNSHQHKHGASAHHHQQNLLGADGHGLRGFVGDQHGPAAAAGQQQHAHADGTPCHHSQVGQPGPQRAQHGQSDGAAGYS